MKQWILNKYCEGEDMVNKTMTILFTIVNFLVMTFLVPSAYFIYSCYRYLKFKIIYAWDHPVYWYKLLHWKYIGKEERRKQNKNSRVKGYGSGILDPKTMRRIRNT